MRKSRITGGVNQWQAHLIGQVPSPSLPNLRKLGEQLISGLFDQRSVG